MLNALLSALKVLLTASSITCIKPALAEQHNADKHPLCCQLQAESHLHLAGAKECATLFMVTQAAAHVLKLARFMPQSVVMNLMLCPMSVSKAAMQVKWPGHLNNAHMLRKVHSFYNTRVNWRCTTHNVCTVMSTMLYHSPAPCNKLDNTGLLQATAPIKHHPAMQIL
jgi:hypothetical protein